MSQRPIKAPIIITMYINTPVVSILFVIYRFNNYLRTKDFYHFNFRIRIKESTYGFSFNRYVINPYHSNRRKTGDSFTPVAWFNRLVFKSNFYLTVNICFQHKPPPGPGPESNNESCDRNY